MKVETPKPPDRFWHLANDRQNDTGDSGEDWQGAEKSMRVRRTLRENGELKCAHQVLGVPWRSGPSTLLDARKQWWQHERKKREEDWREERWNIGRGKRKGGVTKEVELIKQTDSLMDKHYNFLEQPLSPFPEWKPALQEWTKLELCWGFCFPKKYFAGGNHTVVLGRRSI